MRQRGLDPEDVYASLENTQQGDLPISFYSINCLYYYLEEDMSGCDPRGMPESTPCE